MTKAYDYEGVHATADIVMDSYPSNILDIVRDSIKHSKLNIVKESIHDFGNAVTALWTLSESHYSLHEYPEHNYITVDCYTCGKEGDPLAAINNLILELDDAVGVIKTNIKFFKRGDFENKTLDIGSKAFFKTERKEIKNIQKKMDIIAQSLSAEQLSLLDDVINWCCDESSLNYFYNNSNCD